MSQSDHIDFQPFGGGVVIEHRKSGDFFGVLNDGSHSGDGTIAISWYEGDETHRRDTVFYPQSWSYEWTEGRLILTRRGEDPNSSDKPLGDRYTLIPA